MAAKSKMRCDDCKKNFPLHLLDSWARHEDQQESSAELCEKCHDARTPSAWGPWEMGVQP
jgi:hypothetical protein